MPCPCKAKRARPPRRTPRAPEEEEQKKEDKEVALLREEEEKTQEEEPSTAPRPSSRALAVAELVRQNREEAANGQSRLLPGLRVQHDRRTMQKLQMSRRAPVI